MPQSRWVKREGHLLEFSLYFVYMERRLHGSIYATVHNRVLQSFVAAVVCCSNMLRQFVAVVCCSGVEKNPQVNLYICGEDCRRV